MLRQTAYRTKFKFRVWPISRWAKGILFALLGLFFLLAFLLSIQKGSSRLLVRSLLQQSFPFDVVLLEGIPGYSAPTRDRLNEVRHQGLSLGMFLLTGVNVSDTRTYFLSYYSPPPQGPAWLAWAYNPRDPEYEGPVMSEEEPPEIRPESPTVPPNYKDVLVGIYHTHSSESYIGDGGQEHMQGGNGEIVEVGEVLKTSLEQQGIKAIHSTKTHDAEDFMKAYSVSVLTGTQILKDYPQTKFLLDLHRDGRLPELGKSTVKVNGQDSSKILIVLGKKNPHWQQNEAIAKQLIAIAEKKYPGLFVPNISYAADARYNQHLADGALLLELGSQLNSIEESSEAARALADVLAEWFKEYH